MKSSSLLLLCLVLVLCCPLISQQSSSPKPSSADPPALPVIDENACPFEGCTFGEWTVTRETILYDSWKASRSQIGKLAKDQKVTGLTGVHITNKPDTIRLTADYPALSLKRGDTIFRYMYRGEGFADIWANGKWIKEADCSFITEKEDSGCSKNCAAEVVDNGDKEWWVQVRTKSGQTGWAKADDNFNGMDALGARRGVLSAPIA
jgi:hypothetical protein